jgi:hypothetical protein
MAKSGPYLDDVEEPQDEEIKLVSRRRSPKDGAQLQSPLETYLREINETKLLTAEDEQQRRSGPRPNGPCQSSIGRQYFEKLC